MGPSIMLYTVLQCTGEVMLPYTVCVFTALVCLPINSERSTFVYPAQPRHRYIVTALFLNDPKKTRI
jgi:hypothetical protein